MRQVMNQSATAHLLERKTWEISNAQTVFVHGLQPGGGFEVVSRTICKTWARDTAKEWESPAWDSTPLIGLGDKPSVDGHWLAGGPPAGLYITVL